MHTPHCEHHLPSPSTFHQLLQPASSKVIGRHIRTSISTSYSLPDTTYLDPSILPTSASNFSLQPRLLADIIAAVTYFLQLLIRSHVRWFLPPSTYLIPSNLPLLPITSNFTLQLRLLAGILSTEAYLHLTSHRKSHTLIPSTFHLTTSTCEPQSCCRHISNRSTFPSHTLLDISYFVSSNFPLFTNNFSAQSRSLAHPQR